MSQHRDMRYGMSLLFVAWSTFALASTDEVVLRAKSDDVVRALAEKNFAVLAAHMGAKKLRFAPYVNLGQSDRSLSKAQVTSFFTDTGQHIWGTQDGSGNPISLTNSAYYAQFLYNKDFFSSTSVTYNARVATGNTPSNFASVYPGRALYEYYLPPTNPGDLDWYALDVIWQKDASGYWKLVAIAHDQWTI
ncbi:MAG: hypothetical protein JSS66_10035 [Armatimonadetes bacterium]|nr:hypothetical protein [Armatimonadota bacterium]